jgi:peroxiredoxin (alkyl hydroperoxide reductase subunit C)
VSTPPVQEFAAFGRRANDFEDRDTQLVGDGTDTQFLQRAWRKNHLDLKNLAYPLLADTQRELSGAWGVLHEEEGVPLRATFSVDPLGLIRWVSVDDLKVGRRVYEVLRRLEARQIGQASRATGDAARRRSRRPDGSGRRSRSGP